MIQKAAELKEIFCFLVASAVASRPAAEVSQIGVAVIILNDDTKLQKAPPQTGKSHHQALSRQFIGGDRYR